MENVASIVLAGVGATALTDGWAWLRQRLFAVPPPDFGLVGRWLAHMRSGRLRHDRIAAAPPVPGERALGWSAHYLIGIAYAFALLAIWGLEWARQPTPGPALIVGIVSVLAPFLLMQPGMGAGFFASRAPNPAVARIRSLTIHAVFGVSLYLAALAARLL